jgi:hypothetical protein
VVRKIRFLMAANTLSIKDRAAHLPKLIQDLITRLRLPKSAIALDSLSAREHGGTST